MSSLRSFWNRLGHDDRRLLPSPWNKPGGRWTRNGLSRAITAYKETFSQYYQVTFEEYVSIMEPHHVRGINEIIVALADENQDPFEVVDIMEGAYADELNDIRKRNMTGILMDVLALPAELIRIVCAYSAYKNCNRKVPRQSKFHCEYPFGHPLDQ